MGEKLDCFCKGMEFAQSHRPEEAVSDSYVKCEPGLSVRLSLVFTRRKHKYKDRDKRWNKKMQRSVQRKHRYKHKHKRKTEPKQKTFQNKTILLCV